MLITELKPDTELSYLDFITLLAQYPDVRTYTINNDSFYRWVEAAEDNCETFPAGKTCRRVLFALKELEKLVGTENVEHGMNQYYNDNK